MRTLIIDNGEDYSAHTIYFVETDLPVALIEKMLSLQGHGNGYVIGSAESVEWLKPDERCSIADFFGPFEMDGAAWVALSPAEVESLLPAWDEWVKHYKNHAPTLNRIRARLLATPPAPCP